MRTEGNSQNVFGVKLESNLYVDSLPGNVRRFDETAEHQVNNGIFQDGGVTELYESAYNISLAGLFPSDTLYPDAALYPVDLSVPVATYYATNGRRVSIITNVVGAPSVYVTGTDGVQRFVGTISDLFYRRSLVAKRYLDVAISSDGVHGLGVWADYSGIYLDEFLLSDQSITQTQTIVGNTAGWSFGLANAAICRAHVLTFASVYSTSGVVYCSGVTPGPPTYAKLALNGSTYTISALTLTSPTQAGNLVAYYNGGTVIAAIPSATPQILYSSSPWAAWTAATSGGVNGVSMMSQSYMDSTATTLSLAVSTASKTVPNFLIAVSAVGAVTPSSAAGTLYPNLANFTMEAGVVSPLGSAGVYSISGANPYGQFNLSNYRQNSVAAQKPSNAPDLDYNYFPLYLSSVATARVALKSYSGTISILTAGASNIPADGGAMLNDFGGGDFDSDIQGGNVYNSTNTAFVFYPPDYRRQEVGKTNGAWFTYKVNSGGYVLGNIYESGQVDFTEISPGVVSINCLGSANSLIDTNKYTAYENVSGYVNSFFTDQAAATPTMLYARKFNKYSTSIDKGLISADYAGAITVPASAYSYKVNDFSLWNGSTGAYIGNLIVPSGGTTAGTYNNSANAGTYVFNANVPVSCDSPFDGGCVQLLATTAIAMPNYYGYQLANLLSRKYASAFILFGQRYVFDGEWVYAISLSNGDTGTINGIPQRVAQANGLRYLCAGPKAAFFVSDFDNSLYAFNGGRSVDRSQGFSAKSTIHSGVYNVSDDALYLLTTDSILTVRYGLITENDLPYTPYTSFWMDSTDVGVYFVTAASSKIRTYFPVSNYTTQAFIPLQFKTAFFGQRDNQKTKVTKVAAYVYYDAAIPSPLTISWHWQTQDATGVSTATVTPACDTNGYARFDFFPDVQSVTAAQIGITSADISQKIVLLELVYYYAPDADAILAAGNHAS